MKREIKFKAQRLDSKEWVEGSLVNDYLPTRIINDVDVYEVNPKTVLQFTGLLDKDGKEIFEGDIVKRFIINEFRQFVVLFYVDGFALQRLNSVEIYHQKSIRSPKRVNYKDWQTLSIIGNIYDL
jgi:uncharacterized phage protein (TIGR01671 family)